MNLLSVASIVIFLNIPFGYWRANTKKFSRQWFLAVHLPVPAIIALRIFSGLGWEFITFPIMIGAFFLGQFIGGFLYNRLSKLNQLQLSSCLVMDLYKFAVNDQNKK